MRITPWLRGLDVDGLTRLLRCRPEAGEPRPASVDDLAQRLSAPGAVAVAVARLDRDALLVAQCVVVLGDGADLARLRAVVRGPGEALEHALTRLRERALVWPGGPDGSLRFTVALGRHWTHPLDLGPSAWRVLDSMTKDPIRSAARRLGVTLGSTRDDAIGHVLRGLSDPAFVVAVVAKASAPATALLEELVRTPTWTRPPRGEWEPNRYRPEPERQPAEELYDLGLLLAQSSWSAGAVPREVGMALRGPQWGPVLTGQPPLAVAGAGPVDVSGAGTMALGALESLRRVLDAADREPLAVLKTGGIGQREVQRIARRSGVTADAARLWIELALRQGLLGPGPDGRCLPTRRYAPWRVQEATGQWSALVAAWWRSTRALPHGLSTSPVLQSVIGGHVGEVRRTVVDVLRELPAGRCADDLAATVEWRLPSVRGAGQRVAPVLVEAEALGLTVAGALTSVGRALADGGLREAAAGLLPSPVATVVVQSDLTAVASGPVPGATAALLDAAADREGVGVWRFSRASVRRALDDGRTGDGLTSSLAAVASTALPQPLTYLIRDVARIHGAVRVTECGCCVVADDEALLRELVLDSGLELHQVAPTVAVGQVSPAEMLDVLRRAGYAPVIEPFHGVARVERTSGARKSTARSAAGQSPAGSSSDASRPPLSAVHPGEALLDFLVLDVEPADSRALAERLCPGLEPAEIRIERSIERLLAKDQGGGYARLNRQQLTLLAAAAEQGTAVLVEYTKGFSERSAGLYLLDEVQLEPGQIRAWNPGWESDAIFRLSGLTSVDPA